MPEKEFEKNRGFLSGMKIEIPKLGSLVEHFPERGNVLELKRLEGLNRNKIKALIKEDAEVKVRGTFLEHDGSFLVNMRKPKAEKFDGSLGVAPAMQVLPLEFLDSYHFRSKEGELIHNFVVLRKVNHELKLGAGEAEVLKKIQNKESLKEEEARGELGRVKDFFIDLEEVHNPRVRLSPDFKKVRDLKTLLKKLKSKECLVDEKIFDLEKVKNHHHLITAVKEHRAMQHHIDRILQSKKYGETMDFVGDVTGKFRKITSDERKMLKGLGVKPTPFVFELVKPPVENKEVSPKKISELFSKGR